MSLSVLCFKVEAYQVLPQCLQPVHQIFCLIGYMFGIMCHSCLVDPFSKFTHIVRSVDWSECPMHHHADSPLLKPLWSSTTTVSCTHHWYIEIPLPHPHRQFSRSGQPVLQWSPAVIRDTILPLATECTLLKI
jgi:hypothetical protein